MMAIAAATSSSAAAAAKSKVKEYLDSFAHSCDNANAHLFPRVDCCKPSQSMYCKDCYRLIVPDEALPLPIRLRQSSAPICDIDICPKADNVSELTNDEVNRHGRLLKLPFNLHLILDDRKGCSTGIHAVALLGGLRETQNDKSRFDQTNELNTTTVTDIYKLDPSEQSPILEKAMEVYDHDQSTNSEEELSTYFLFPSPGESVALEEVSNKVKTLIVLDCKWTKSGAWRRSERLRCIPKVHLSNPPQESYFWRWHNAGEGMMSTIEAIYYASLEVYQGRYKQMVVNSSPQTHLDECLIDERNSIHLLWLFGLQRQAIIKRAEEEGKPAPCSEDGKEIQRECRRRKTSWRPKEVGS